MKVGPQLELPPPYLGFAHFTGVLLLFGPPQAQNKFRACRRRSRKFGARRRRRINYWLAAGAEQISSPPQAPHRRPPKRRSRKPHFAKNIEDPIKRDLAAQHFSVFNQKKTKTQTKPISAKQNQSRRNETKRHETRRNAARPASLLYNSLDTS